MNLYIVMTESDQVEFQVKKGEGKYVSKKFTQEDLNANPNFAQIIYRMMRVINGLE